MTIENQQKHILDNLLGQLWKNYRTRVSYVNQYAELVESQGGLVINDHIALRSFNIDMGGQPAGITALERIFLAVGYHEVETYRFESKHLNAKHYEHFDPLQPKIFISQLEVSELSEQSQKLISDATQNCPAVLSGYIENMLVRLAAGETIPESEEENLVESLVSAFARPWNPPLRETVLQANEESQYAAWTLLHGNSINHFTAYINKQNVPAWEDLESTVAGLREAGIPMKNAIEGEKGSKLQQSSTEAVNENCAVSEADGTQGLLEWSYAYYELAERGNITDDNGNQVEFSGFLGDQATHLFEMTKR